LKRTCLCIKTFWILFSQLLIVFLQNAQEKMKIIQKMLTFFFYYQSSPILLLKGYWNILIEAMLTKKMVNTPCQTFNDYVKHQLFKLPTMLSNSTRLLILIDQWLLKTPKFTTSNLCLLTIASSFLIFFFFFLFFLVGGLFNAIMCINNTTSSCTKVVQ